MQTSMILLFCLFVLLFLFAILSPTQNEDFDITDKRSGPSATPWRHVHVCTECREETGHQEYMTQICLSCGRKMKYLPRNAAVRTIFFNGKFRKHLHDNGVDYLRENKSWVKYETPKKENHDAK